jgi:CheY-like chemotaxis protein
LQSSDPLRSFAEEIREAGGRAVSLTKQLLAFSRKQVIEPRVVDLNETIRQSALMFRRLIGEDITIETRLGGSLGQVMADPDQIHQVLMNLVVNARDAMPDGGRLHIATANVELGVEASAAVHADAAPGRYVAMTVSDTGRGIDETIRQQIFEPFFTTKEAGNGTGLGLATVHGIIRQSGGWIDVSSEVGQGTTFTVYLPRIDACPMPEEGGIGSEAQQGSETILVAEDQRAVRTFTVAALRERGYRVLEASDGNEATAVAGRHSGELHLLLTDVVMPGMNGKELSERLKDLHPRMKVLFISGYTADVIAHRGVLDRGVAFLHKPFSPEEAARKVREVLDRPTEPMVEQ